MDCDRVSVIEVSSPSLLARIMRSFIQLQEGEQPLESFYFATDEQVLPAARLLTVVSDLFHIEFNSRKILGLLYKQVEKLINEDPQLFQAFQQKKQELLAQFDFICRPINVELTRDEGDGAADFCKYINLRISVGSDQRLVVQLQCFMDILAEWLPGQVLVLYNLTSLLADSELQEVFRYALFTKVNLLLIEPFSGKSLRPNEQRWVIGEDFDDYVLN